MTHKVFSMLSYVGIKTELEKGEALWHPEVFREGMKKAVELEVLRGYGEG
jgi:hypothetical protein